MTITLYFKEGEQIRKELQEQLEKKHKETVKLESELLEKVRIVVH